MSVIVYEVLAGSENDPDHSPGAVPAQGMWVWWRTGPHPQGRWQAMELSQSVPGGKETYEAWRANWNDHPIFQDQAFGDSGDFGNFICHACDYLSDGYPEPNHRTVCDGICKRANCAVHGQGGKDKALAELKGAYDWAVSRGFSVDEIRKHLAL